MKTKILVALLGACALTLSMGCDKKDDAGGKTSTAASDSKGGAAKVCEDYFALNKKCIEKAIASLPDQATKDMTKKTMEDAEKQWKDMLKDPASAAAAESGCKAALDALKNNPACK
jgi:hypothetical protein